MPDIGPAIDDSVVQLQATVTNGTASFSYSLDGKTFTSFGDTAVLKFSRWKGAHPGLFSFNTGSQTNAPAGIADFDWFHYQPMVGARLRRALTDGLALRLAAGL